MKRTELLQEIRKIASSVWIDEDGMSVRPAEAAPAPPPPTPAPPRVLPPGTPQRFVDSMAEAAKIRKDAQGDHSGLLDWVANGKASRFALSPDALLDHSRTRDAAKALGHAHFALATQDRRGKLHRPAAAVNRALAALQPQTRCRTRYVCGNGSHRTSGQGPLGA